MATKISLKPNNVVTLPLVAMRGVVMFPDTVNHFDVGRERSIKAVEYAVKTGSPIFLIPQRDMAVEEPSKSDLYKYGVVADIQQVLRVSDSFVKVLASCRHRARLIEMHSDGDFYTVDVIRSGVHALKASDEEAADALVRVIRDQLQKYIEHYPRLAGDIVIAAYGSGDPARFAEFLAFNLNLPLADKQAVLECSNVLGRLKLLHDALLRENNVLDIERDINDKVQEAMDQNQREYYLREQLKAISTELGEGPDTVTESEEYRAKIKELPLAEEHKKKLLKEVERLMQTPSNSQEAAVIRTYLDTLVELPWKTFSKDNYDLKRAEKILNRDHYGLKKVKERILEYIAVKSLTDNPGAQILCLVGPPGVGKTSVARSIAECLGRKFVRMSLGGVHDESEIRGHRRTYVAAMPGRIINAVEQAGTANPLILLDEIDKLGKDYRGDPSSALLEVLDPEQNATFRDHFLDVPFDLSKVMFITTANDASAIPAPLYDRMDVIELSSYTREDKFKIAKQHLIKKQLEKHGLDRTRFSLTDSALYSLIDDYTREAGVRELERKLASVIRKAAKKIVSGESESVKVTAAMLEGMLGVKLTHGSIVSHLSTVGLVNGLAWTSVGGEVMPIEVVAVKGSGKLEITGSLGDVMKESAKLAVSNTRLLSGRYAIPEGLMTEWDIHIHAPEGAVPKDGPSAGVTLVTALVSALTGLPVRKDIAMTGEITLKGRVLPIGGLKEKLIAAYKEKLSTVLIPKDNVCDLQDIPEEVLKALDIVPVDTVEAVLKRALVQSPRRAPRAVENTARESAPAPLAN